MRNKTLVYIILLSLVVLWFKSPITISAQASDDPNPPSQAVKLIFIHHSTGGNWLADPEGNALGGGLGQALMENNYYVSATNYGWGPDGIGDRTDIINWPEWFTGANSEVILSALYAESGQNVGDFGSWPRLAEDPGGENQIILFKSCFPNSSLGGSPTDPPAAAPNEDMTVANAKAVYNQILTYFATRQDKLFIVVTAPPLADFDTDAATAANARAFNNWLVTDWLSGYANANVAVFDFYNVLTSGPSASRNDAGQETGNHHRFWANAVQHIQTVDNNFLVYPSGDSHPSRAGNEKATSEFVSLLNIYYNRWMSADRTNPPTPAPATEAPVEAPATDVPAAQSPGASAIIDDFESAPPAASGWQPFRDEGTSTSISCASTAGMVNSGTKALQIDFGVAANSWATCALMYGQPQDWSAWQGITFYLHASQPALVFDLDIYRNTPQGSETYLLTIEAPQGSAEGWIPIGITWDQLLRASWEADSGTPLSAPILVEGLAYGLSTYPDTPNTGSIWVDDLKLWGFNEPLVATPGPAATAQTTQSEATQAAPVVNQPAPTEAQQAEVPPPETEPTLSVQGTSPTVEENKPRGKVCPSVFAAPLAIMAVAVWTRKRKG